MSEQIPPRTDNQIEPYESALREIEAHTPEQRAALVESMVADVARDPKTYRPLIAFCIENAAELEAKGYGECVKLAKAVRDKSPLLRTVE